VINGKKYDAVTGKMISGTAPSKPNKPIVQPITNKTGVVDGFVKRPAQHKSRQTPAHHVQNTPKKSSTLMRKSVSKPQKSAIKPKKVQHTVQKSSLGSSSARVEQAKQTPKSQHIQKYSQPTARTSVIKKSSSALAVKAAPANQAAKRTTETVPATAKNQPKPRSAAAEKMISAALANADSHNEKPHAHSSKKHRKIIKKLGISTRTAAVSSAVLAGVLLGGFFAVQNVPNLSMRVAAARAGFDATMPGYSPSGFSFKGPIQYSAGRVTVSYRSNSDSRAYDVMEQSSNWNSDALLANYIVAENKQYQTYLDRGRTLYIYDGSNATWVDNGIWYQIEGESSMTTDQLIRIAASI